MDERVVSVLLTRAADVPGAWVAHCLDLDVVTQGSSVDDALRMAREAVLLVVDDDIAAGLDPFERSMAPDEDWDRMLAVQRRGRPIGSLSSAQRERLTAVVARLRLPASRAALSSSVWEAPAWQIAQIAA